MAAGWVIPTRSHRRSARTREETRRADPGRCASGFAPLRCDGTGDSDPASSTAVQAAAKLCESLGHQVSAEAVAPLDDPGLGAALPPLWAGVIAREVDRWSERIGRPIAIEELEPLNQALVGHGRGSVPRARTSAHWRRAALGARRGGWFADFDVLMVPTIPEPPFPLGRIGAPVRATGSLQLLDAGSLITFTLPFNATGQPAMSLPLGTSSDGLPIGVQFVAPFGREDVLFRLAAQLESAAPWADRRPPVAAA